MCLRDRQTPNDHRNGYFEFQPELPRIRLIGRSGKSWPRRNDPAILPLDSLTLKHLQCVQGEIPADRGALLSFGGLYTWPLQFRCSQPSAAQSTYASPTLGHLIASNPCRATWQWFQAESGSSRAIRVLHSVSERVTLAVRTQKATRGWLKR